MTDAVPAWTALAFGTGVRESANSIESRSPARRIWRFVLDTYERPDVEFMQRAVVNIGGRGVDDGSVADCSRRSHGLLLVGDVVFGRGLNAGRLDANDGRVHRNAGQVWVRTKAFPDSAATSTAAHWPCRGAKQWLARLVIKFCTRSFDRTLDAHANLCL